MAFSFLPDRAGYEQGLCDELKHCLRDRALEPHHHVEVELEGAGDAAAEEPSHTVFALSYGVSGKDHDRYAEWVDEGSQYGVVCDGHNGAEVAEQATCLLPMVVKDHAAQREAPDGAVKSMAEVLTDAIIETDLRLYQRSRSLHGRYETQGTTLTAYACEGNTATLAWLGDSRAVLAHDNKAVVLTADHNRTSNAAEEARVNALVSEPLAVGVTRALGNYSLKNHADHTQHVVSNRPETVTFTMNAGTQFVLIASDGLWDLMSPDDAVAFVCDKLASEQVVFDDVAKYCFTPNNVCHDKKGYLRKLCEALYRKAVERRHPSDDITIMLILTRDIYSYYTPPLFSPGADSDILNTTDPQLAVETPADDVLKTPPMQPSFSFHAYQTPAADRTSCLSLTPVGNMFGGDDDFDGLLAEGVLDPVLPAGIRSRDCRLGEAGPPTFP